MENTAATIQIVVLKTSITSDEELSQPGEVLEKAESVLKRSVDRADSDRVLRIEMHSTTRHHVTIA